MFTIEFYRIRDADDAHATLARVAYDGADLADAQASAKVLFVTQDMPQKPDGLRILNQSGEEVFTWRPGVQDN